VIAWILALAVRRGRRQLRHDRDYLWPTAGRQLIVDLLVDFNMTEEDGRVPALLLAGQAPRLSIGEWVRAHDWDGNECQAVVSELLPGRRIAMLALDRASWRTSTLG